MKAQPERGAGRTTENTEDHMTLRTLRINMTRPKTWVTHGKHGGPVVPLHPFLPDKYP